MINRLSSALVKDGTTCINPLDALRALKDGLEQHTSIARDEKEQYLNFIYEARKEYDEIAKNEVQKAFVYSFEESARTLFENYLDNVEAFCNKEKIRDPLTEEEMDPDEKLMRSIEEQIGVTENAKKGFREELLIRMSSLARRGQKFEYTTHERLKPVEGTQVVATAHYRTTNTSHAAVTGSSGTAAIPFRISGATVGYTVAVDVETRAAGGTALARTSFTPR